LAGQFYRPQVVALDAGGNLYLVQGDLRVQKFTPNRQLAAEWRIPSDLIGNDPTVGGIAVDKHGNVYVTLSGSHRVLMFGQEGNFLGSFGARGAGNGQFITPRGIAVDENDNIYVVDQQNHRVQVFSRVG